MFVGTSKWVVNLAALSPKAAYNKNLNHEVDQGEGWRLKGGKG